jgi:hypothetical protein
MFLVATVSSFACNPWDQFGPKPSDPCPPDGNPAMSATFNLSMTVDKYIEVMASPVSFDFGTTVHSDGAEQLCSSNTGVWNLAYANCPFKVTISGTNAAGDAFPRFARAEVGAHASGFDVLPTFYDIKFATNGQEVNFWNQQWMPAASFPYTATFSETPHNGQVKMSLAAKVNTDDEGGIAQKKSKIDPTYTARSSADAGVYTAKMIVTLAAI